ncbi:MAG: type II toxin-antitoxin system Phd/YefM family antitoxin [Burkholderiaceae bacterium]
MTELKRWPVQDAKSRFSELLDACLSNGPQLVTRRGIETAVLVPVEQWEALRDAARPTLKELLLRKHGPHDLVVPERGNARRRPPATME